MPRIPHVIFIHLEIVRDVRIHSHPEFVFEGQELVLICSVNGVPRPITVSWYKKQPSLWKDRELQTSSKTEFKVPVVQSSDAGEYYCIARNGRFSLESNLVIISVKGVSAKYHLQNSFSNCKDHEVVEWEWVLIVANNLLL